MPIDLAGVHAQLELSLFLSQARRERRSSVVLRDGIDVAKSLERLHKKLGSKIGQPRCQGGRVLVESDVHAARGQHLSLIHI